MRRIGIVVVRRQIDRLSRGPAVTRCSMRKKALIPVSPQQRVERLDALFARGLDRGAPAALERPFEQVRQDVVERAALQMVEINFRRAPLTHGGILWQTDCRFFASSV